MAIATINIQVNERIAQRYAASTEAKRGRLRTLIAYLVMLRSRGCQRIFGTD